MATDIAVSDGERVALAYADRMEAGDATYDPNVATLAESVRALRAENERMRRIVAVAFDQAALEQAADALQAREALEQTIAGLNATLDSEIHAPHLHEATLQQLVDEVAIRVNLAAANRQDWALERRDRQP